MGLKLGKELGFKLGSTLGHRALGMTLLLGEELPNVLLGSVLGSTLCPLLGEALTLGCRLPTSIGASDTFSPLEWMLGYALG